MPVRIPDAKRAKVAADIRAGQMSRNEIARKYRISPASVGNIAAEEGITDAFDRTHTIKGAHAKAADNKMRRAQLASDLLDDAQRLRKRAWEPYEVVASTPDGAEVVQLALPPLPDARAAYTAIGICSDKSIAIEKHDISDDGADHAKSMLGRLLTGLAQAVSGEPPETPQDEG
jgi:hypothetical protein